MRLCQYLLCRLLLFVYVVIFCCILESMLEKPPDQESLREAAEIVLRELFEELPIRDVPSYYHPELVPDGVNRYRRDAHFIFIKVDENIAAQLSGVTAENRIVNRVEKGDIVGFLFIQQASEDGFSTTGLNVSAFRPLQTWQSLTDANTGAPPRVSLGNGKNEEVDYSRPLPAIIDDGLIVRSPGLPDTGVEWYLKRNLVLSIEIMRILASTVKSVFTEAQNSKLIIDDVDELDLLHESWIADLLFTRHRKKLLTP